MRRWRRLPCREQISCEETEPRQADGTYWVHLRGLYADCEIVPAGAHPFAEVRTRMLELWQEQLGLDLLCICADRAVGADRVRSIAAEVVDAAEAACYPFADAYEHFSRSVPIRQERGVWLDTLCLEWQGGVMAGQPGFLMRTSD